MAKIFHNHQQDLDQKAVPVVVVAAVVVELKEHFLQEFRAQVVVLLLPLQSEEAEVDF